MGESGQSSIIEPLMGNRARNWLKTFLGVFLVIFFAGFERRWIARTTAAFFSVSGVLSRKGTEVDNRVIT
jgi:hypothetical protein